MRSFVWRWSIGFFTAFLSFSVALAGQLCTVQTPNPVVRGKAAAYDYSCIVNGIPAGDVMLVDVRPETDRQTRFRRVLRMSRTQLMLATRLKQKSIVVFDGAYSVKRSAQLCHQLKTVGFTSVVIPHGALGELVRRFGMAPESARLRDFAFLRTSQVRTALGDGAWQVLAVGEPSKAAQAGLPIRWFPDAETLRSWFMTEAARGGIYRYLLAGIDTEDVRDLADLDGVFWTDVRPADLFEFLARLDAAGGIPVTRSVQCAAS